MKEYTTIVVETITRRVKYKVKATNKEVAAALFLCGNTIGEAPFSLGEVISRSIEDVDKIEETKHAEPDKDHPSRL